MDDGNMRSFDTGATRDTGEGKLDPEGFVSPAVLRQFFKYMNMNRLQSNGELRDSDNWQKGIPLDAYMKSGWRHFFEWWEYHRGDQGESRESVVEGMAALCGLLFNVMGYMHETLKLHDMVDFDFCEPTQEMDERQKQVEAKKGFDKLPEDGVLVVGEDDPIHILADKWLKFMHEHPELKPEPVGLQPMIKMVVPATPETVEEDPEPVCFNCTEAFSKCRTCLTYDTCMRLNCQTCPDSNVCTNRLNLHLARESAPPCFRCVGDCRDCPPTMDRECDEATCTDCVFEEQCEL